MLRWICAISVLIYCYTLGLGDFQWVVIGILGVIYWNICGIFDAVGLILLMKLEQKTPEESDDYEID